MSRIILNLIKIYQRTLSPDHSWRKIYFPYGYCRFYPSCSEYSFQAVERFGWWKGSRFGLRRILRCHPYAPPAVDLVPPNRPVNTN